MKSFKMLMMAALTILSVSVFAQSTPSQSGDTTAQKIKKQKTEKAKYTCPMHPDVVMNEPGKCSKCGMDLAKTKKEQMKMEVMKTYTCPMHPDMTSDTPGKCPKCQSKMNLTQKEQMKMEVMKTYTCPMHPGVTSNKSGKCPNCGMAMKEVAATTQTWACPMHPEVTSDKPGKCSKCRMNLNLATKEKMKMDVMKVYSCPMHPDVTSDKPGKCPSCNMDLTEKKTKTIPAISINLNKMQAKLK